MSSSTILFYTSAEPGAAPFVRVPATPEGLRYAGYYARYRNGRAAAPRLNDCADRVLHPRHLAWWYEGFAGYPTNPGIPLGTERYVVLGGDSEWRRYDPNQPADPEGPRPWVTVSEGAPSPRGRS